MIFLILIVGDLGTLGFAMNDNYGTPPFYENEENAKYLEKFNMDTERDETKRLTRLMAADWRAYYLTVLCLFICMDIRNLIFDSF